MKKIFRCEDSDDWKMWVQEQVPDSWFKINNVLGILLNIAVPAILLFYFHLSIPTMILCYIIFDILMVPMDYLSIGMYKILKTVIWLPQKAVLWLPKKAAYEKKVQNMSIDEINALKDELDAHDKFVDEKLEIINQRIEEYKRLDSIVAPSQHKDTIKYVKEMIEKMRAYSDDDIPFDQCDKCIKWIQKSMAEIVKKSDGLMNIILDDPDSVMQIVNVYNVYAEEMLRIVIKYQEADEEQQEKMRPKLEALLNTFSEKIDRLDARITSSRERSLDIDIDYLTKKLNEDVESNKNEEG